MKQTSISSSANNILGTLRLIPALLLAIATIPGPALAISSDHGMEQFERTIDTRCTLCHTRERIDLAIAEKRDLAQIRSMMLERGAVLTERDKKVLGTFWGDPLKDSDKPVARATENGFREYRTIIETHCTGCHARERIDGMIRQQLPYETVEEVLLKRGVVLSEREKEVIGTFWGTPLRNR